MNDDQLVSLAQLREFVKLSKGAKFKSRSKRKETYEWIGRTLGKFHYHGERKKNRGIIKKYIISVTGYSEGLIDKLIRRKKERGTIIEKERTQNKFEKFYDVSDTCLIAESVNVLNNPNGFALRKYFEDMYKIYEDNKFEKLSKISVSHIYNLKKTRVFKSRVSLYEKTKPTTVNIGERRKPRPNGKPGFLRVDSVHQGDLDKEKGVYYINIVDEVTQWEYVGCVPAISEYYLESLLEGLINLFPFMIVNFHSDNGSEYINKTVSRLLNKLHISQTKSRARHSNDNGLAESKNCSIIRKNMGYCHIPKRHADSINEFLKNHLNPHVNFHRHSAYATDYIDERGKIKKKYETYLTPCQKFLSLPDCEKYLNPGITKELLLVETKRMTHFESAKRLQEAKTKLFKEISPKV